MIRQRMNLMIVVAADLSVVPASITPNAHVPVSIAAVRVSTSLVTRVTRGGTGRHESHIEKGIPCLEKPAKDLVARDPSTMMR